MNMSNEDKRTERPGIPLSPNEMTLIDQARGETPRARWIREAVLERLEREGVDVTDDARRPAARRSNYRQRAAKEAGK